jgi:hypothetical protein
MFFPIRYPAQKRKSKNSNVKTAVSPPFQLAWNGSAKTFKVIGFVGMMGCSRGAFGACFVRILQLHFPHIPGRRTIPIIDGCFPGRFKPATVESVWARKSQTWGLNSKTLFDSNPFCWSKSSSM